MYSTQRCVLPVSFPVVLPKYYGSNESTGKETGKTHLCAVGYIIPNDKSLTLLDLKMFRQAFYSIHIESILFYIM